MSNDDPIDLRYYPTPQELLSEVENCCAFARSLGEKLDAVDLFAGDGRLARAVSRGLEANGQSASMTVVEIDEGRAAELTGSMDLDVVRADVFSWRPGKKFDLVVMNPPYMRLDREGARRHGISWESASLGGRNLYGVALLKALELSRPGGLVLTVMPYSWLHSVFAAAFRGVVADCAEMLETVKFGRQRVFKGVTQDVALQILRRRKSRGLSQSPGKPVRRLTHAEQATSLGDEVALNAKVGEIVWNRRIRDLGSSSPDAIPLVYGGNIRSDHVLDFTQRKYAGRQFILQAALRTGELKRGPLLLIRRTLRGHPGAWIVDWVVVPCDMEVAVENHVLSVTLGSGRNDDLVAHSQGLVDALALAVRPQGHPSIAISTLKRLLPPLDAFSATTVCRGPAMSADTLMEPQ